MDIIFELLFENLVDRKFVSAKKILNNAFGVFSIVLYCDHINLNTRTQNKFS